ncbi:MAG: right-handed parallel beta-helix repeat-containing protein [Anaerolineales bacterium]|nr:right-handed parallel beta-helix repeat-containing protein [Anaerolineales bacterium]
MGYRGWKHNDRESRQDIGGGITTRQDNTSILINNIIANNGKEGIYSYRTENKIINNTIVDNNLDGPSGGIMLSGSDYYPIVKNNIVISHSIGIQNITDITRVIDYNNVWSNWTANLDGTYTGTHNISVNPRFVDAENGDYHFLNDSPCIDVGSMEIWILTDIDGDDRPIVSGYDIGADEVYGRVYLPLIVRSNN